MVLNAGTPSKNVSFKKVIFRGLRLFHSHFGQHVPENLVSQLQNGVLTSFLPPFIVDLGKGPATKLDDFLEKIQMAFDPRPLSFLENYIADFL